MKILRLTLIIAFCLLQVILSEAQMTIDPVKWSYNVNQLKGNEAELVFDARIAQPWHLYTQYFPDGGPIRLTFNFEPSNKYELIGKVTETPAPKKLMDEIFKIEIQYFADHGIFKQKIKILSKEEFEIKGNMEYQVCNDDKCVMFTPEYIFKIKGVIEKVGNVNKVIETGSIENNTTSDSLKQLVKIAITDTIKTKITASQDATLKPLQVSAINTEYESMSLWIFFLLSFLGGLIALLTPCIYPMIPLTVSFFMHDTKSRSKSIRQALFYGFSIVIIFLLLGLIVSLFLGEDFNNWLSTHWLPNIFFFIIFMIFAASFLGMFEITLPSWMIDKSEKKSEKGGFGGAFFMAFTLVLVSFSCTAPIVGTIISFSAQGQIIKPVIGMFGFSLAFALPFTLFAIFPSGVKSLPKSGGWLNSVKVVLGFIEIALGLKFLSVADQTYHWGILDREVYLALWIAIFFLMGVYLLGKLKFSHDSELKFLGVPRCLLAILTFAFVVYLIPGMFGAPLKALTGWIPPQTSQDFDLDDLINKNSLELQDKIGQGVANNSNSLNSTTICETPKYADKLHLPHNLKGYFDYDEGLACAKKLKKPIFMDFTGLGCVNCRKMEEFVWSDQRVIERLRNNYVIIELFVDDKRIKLPEAEWYTSKYDKKLKKSLGEKNFDMQISKYNSNSQPLYVLLDGDGNLLVKPRGYNINIEAFIKFLDDGVTEFNKKIN